MTMFDITTLGEAGTGFFALALAIGIAYLSQPLWNKEKLNVKVKQK